MTTVYIIVVTCYFNHVRFGIGLTFLPPDYSQVFVNKFHYETITFVLSTYLAYFMYLNIHRFFSRQINEQVHDDCIRRIIIFIAFLCHVSLYL